MDVACMPNPFADFPLHKYMYELQWQASNSQAGRGDFCFFPMEMAEFFNEYLDADVGGVGCSASGHPNGKRMKIHGGVFPTS
jgi:hypothetical protein